MERSYSYKRAAHLFIIEIFGGIIWAALRINYTAGHVISYRN